VGGIPLHRQLTTMSAVQRIHLRTKQLNTDFEENENAKEPKKENKIKQS